MQIINPIEILKNLNILYIEDEVNIRLNVTKTLLMICKEVFAVESSEDAKKLLLANRVDIIITDINLPNLNGIEFIKEIRVIDKHIPIIILSAYTDINYLLEATSLKLIDYLTKPINFKILQDSLKKATIDLIDNSRYIISFSNSVSYNVLHKKLFETTSNDEINLTSKEIVLLDYLLTNKNRIISHDEIKLNIWEDSFEATDSALKNLLNKLRKKIGKDTISNISGVGYKINI